MNEWDAYSEKIVAANPETKAEYDRLGPKYRAIADLIRIRHERGLSQEELAMKMGKQQPAIARLESGRVTPTIKFLEELAEALDARLVVRLEPLDAEAAG